MLLEILSLVLLLAFLIVVVVMASKRTLILWDGFGGYFIMGFYNVKVFPDRNFWGAREKNQEVTNKVTFWRFSDIQIGSEGNSGQKLQNPARYLGCLGLQTKESRIQGANSLADSQRSLPGLPDIQRSWSYGCRQLAFQLYSAHVVGPAQTQPV